MGPVLLDLVYACIPYMIRVCAWCSHEIGPDGAPGQRIETTGALAPHVTHGICNICKQKHFKMIPTQPALRRI
mgnify:CR=1 FL=1